MKRVWSSPRRYLAVLIGAAAVSAALVSATPAGAACGGYSCLPGSGYTFDQTWGCGVIPANGTCYAPGVTSRSNAEAHTYGYGSAIYNGSGNPVICVAAIIQGGTYVPFGWCGNSLARACYLDSCNDVGTATNMTVAPQNTAHTVSGHGKA
jgi:hypothetical protein